MAGPAAALAAIQIAKLGADAVWNLGEAWRARREAKDLEGSKAFKTATKAGDAALGRMTDKDGHAVQESVVDKEADLLFGKTSKIAEQEKADQIFAGPSTTADMDLRSQIADSVASNRLQAMTLGREHALQDMLAKKAVDKDLFQIGQSYKDRLAQIKGGGRQAMASGLTTLGAGGLTLGGKAVYDQYKADRDDSTPAAFGTDEDVKKKVQWEAGTGVMEVE